MVNMSYDAFFALVFLLALVAAAISFIWFIVSSTKAARRQQKPRFTTLTLAGVFIVLAGLSFFSCGGWLVPPHIPWAQVNVAYVGPKVSPSNDVAYFIKVVTQEHQGLVPHWGGGPLKSLEGWDRVANLEWSRTFLCRSKPDGVMPESVSEISSQQYPPPYYQQPGWDLGRSVAGFDVSWARQKEVVAFASGTNNLQVIDMRTGASTRTTYPVSPYGFFSLKVIDNQTKVLLGAGGDTAVLDLDGGMKTLQLPSGMRMCWPTPFWNEEQKVIVFLVSHGSLKEEELCVFNSDLELIERVDAVALAKLWTRNNRWRRKTDDKYAWVMEERWHSHAKPRPESSPFPFQTHTIEHKRIHPEEAASIW